MKILILYPIKLRWQILTLCRFSQVQILCLIQVQILFKKAIKIIFNTLTPCLIQKMCNPAIQIKIYDLQVKQTTITIIKTIYKNQITGPDILTSMRIHLLIPMIIQQHSKPLQEAILIMIIQIPLVMSHQLQAIIIDFSIISCLF